MRKEGREGGRGMRGGKSTYRRRIKTEGGRERDEGGGGGREVGKVLLVYYYLVVLRQRETDSLRFSELHRRMKSQVSSITK